MPTYEGLRLKLLKFRRIVFANRRQKRLNNTNFTIISNNCWGGMTYETYNLPKQSPTVGLFFMAEDYIKFISDLKGYLSEDLRFISPRDSKWRNAKEIKNDSHFGQYPIGKLGDIEIFFLHYESEEQAKEKWERRVERINWDKLLIKFNDQNGCKKSDLETFLKLPYKNKIFFTSQKWDGISSDEIVYIPQFSKNNFIMASYEPFGKNKHFDVNDLLNKL